MKTLHVESGMHLYGGALQVVFLLRGLAARGEQPLLACPSGSAIAGSVRALGLPVHEMPMGGDLDVGLLGRLRALIRAERPDLVHLHSRRGSDLWGGLAARLEGVPAVLSRRVDNPEPRWWVARKYRLYAQVIAISEGIRRVLLAEGLTPQQVVCVHSAVDTEAYRPAPGERAWVRAEFGLPADAPLIAMAAQFIPRKGHRTLLAALPAVFAAQPQARVLLFGQGPEHAAIDALVRQAGWGDRVLLPGFRRDLARIVPGIDVLAHPAEMEGLGVALLQAAACGVPIVAGRAGGIPEIVRPGLNGELIEPGDAEALAGHLIRLLADTELRRRYGEAGRRLVLDEFSVDAMVEGNRAVYAAVSGRTGVR
ncbi:MAG TPA: glycosyltransferase [Methylibium sp.]|nr:glycosyltransferase [Methylibium sp.]